MAVSSAGGRLLFLLADVFGGADGVADGEVGMWVVILVEAGLVLGLSHLFAEEALAEGVGRLVVAKLGHRLVLADKPCEVFLHYVELHRLDKKLSILNLPPFNNRWSPNPGRSSPSSSSATASSRPNSKSTSS